MRMKIIVTRCFQRSEISVSPAVINILPLRHSGSQLTIASSCSCDYKFHIALDINPFGHQFINNERNCTMITCTTLQITSEGVVNAKTIAKRGLFFRKQLLPSF